MQLMNLTDKILQDPVTAETLAAAGQNGGIPFTMDQFNKQQTLAFLPQLPIIDTTMSEVPKEIAPLPTKGRLSIGPVDIYHRPFVKNSDGSVSTILSGIYDDDSGYHVYAGVGSDGTIYPGDEAMQRAITNGDNVIATFDNLENAEAFDKALHERQEKSLDYMDDPDALAKFQFRSEYADHPERFVDENTYKIDGQAFKQAPAIIPNDANQVPQANQYTQLSQEAPVEQIIPGMLGDSSELDKNLRRAQQAEIERRMAPPPTLNMMARQFAGQILDAKNTYAQGEALYNDEKTKDKGAQVMDLAHKAAMKARNGLENLGINPDDYGLNGSAEDVADAIGQNDMRAMQSFLYGPLSESSGRRFDQIYDYLMENGGYEASSRAVAAKYAKQYQRERTDALIDAFYTYGVGNDTITQAGVQLLAKIGEEDSQLADYLLKTYAGRKDEYAFRKQLGLAEQAHNYKQADIDRKGAYDMQKAKIGAEAKLKAAQISAAARERAAQISASRPRSSGGGSGSRGGLSKSQNALLNKLKTLREYAYQSMGTVYNPGTTFSDEDDHNVDEYRQALVDAKKSGDVDEEDREWLQEQLNELENTYTAIKQVVDNTQ